MKSQEVPSEFYDRSDAIIELANAQLNDESRGKVSASTLYAAARFNAFTSAANYSSGEEMTKDLAEIVDYFVEQYRKMLKENLEDYAEKFSEYVR
ncbi:MAG: DUF3144 domain-containing protein [Roseibium album]|nr:MULTISPECIES: DUF3144 domain-containing protein [Stappiaceae]